jgi:hypothetical protein
MGSDGIATGRIRLDTGGTERGDRNWPHGKDITDGRMNGNNVYKKGRLSPGYLEHGRLQFFTSIDTYLSD